MSLRSEAAYYAQQNEASKKAHENYQAFISQGISALVTPRRSVAQARQAELTYRTKGLI